MSTIGLCTSYESRAQYCTPCGAIVFVATVRVEHQRCSECTSTGSGREGGAQSAREDGRFRGRRTVAPDGQQLPGRLRARSRHLQVAVALLHALHWRGDETRAQVRTHSRRHRLDRVPAARDCAILKAKNSTRTVRSTVAALSKVRALVRSN